MLVPHHSPLSPVLYLWMEEVDLITLIFLSFVEPLIVILGIIVRKHLLIFFLWCSFTYQSLNPINYPVLVH